MSTPITVQVPEEALIEALRRLSPERRRELLQQVDEKQGPQVPTLPVEALYELTGIIEVGGDALVESELIYDE